MCSTGARSCQRSQATTAHDVDAVAGKGHRQGCLCHFPAHWSAMRTQIVRLLLHSEIATIRDRHADKEMPAMPSPRMNVPTPVIGAPDPHVLGTFYAKLLDWNVVENDADWMAIEAPAGEGGRA